MRRTWPRTREDWRYWRIIARAGFVSFPLFPIPKWEEKLGRAANDLEKLRGKTRYLPRRTT